MGSEMCIRDSCSTSYTPFLVAPSTELIHYIHRTGDCTACPFCRNISHCLEGTRDLLLRYGRARPTPAIRASNCGQSCAMDSGTTLFGSTWPLRFGGLCSLTYLGFFLVHGGVDCVCVGKSPCATWKILVTGMEG